MAARNAFDAGTRQGMALAGLQAQGRRKGTVPLTVSAVAAEFGTSRKFVYAQMEKAEGAVSAAFESPEPGRQFVVVDAAWIERVVLSAALTCHGSVRGICEHVEALCGQSVSEGTVAAILSRASQRADSLLAVLDLGGIEGIALDEIFCQRQPVLVGVDVKSTYVFLLEASPRRDGASWWVALEAKKEGQGLAPAVGVMDQARGMHVGLHEAYPDIDQRDDLFHGQRELTGVVRALEKSAYRSLGEVDKLEKKLARAKGKGRRNKWAAKHATAVREAEAAMALYDDVWVLSGWLQEVFPVVGAPATEREWTYEFVTNELTARAALEPKIGKLARYLTAHQAGLLRFAHGIEEELDKLVCPDTGFTPEVVRLAYQQHQYRETDGEYWNLEGKLLSRLGQWAATLKERVSAVLAAVVRASSLVECINSLLRPYFALRKTLGTGEFLALLQFYLNTRKYRRSQKPERKGKSPLTLLTGQDHPHWLELLGYHPLTVL